MAQQSHRLVAHMINEVGEQRHNIVVAVQAVGRRVAHARQIWIDPPVSRAGNDSFQRRLDLAVINADAV
jgi:hypothetical protein